MDLRQRLGCDVDIATEAGLRPRIAQRALVADIAVATGHTRVRLDRARRPLPSDSVKAQRWAGIGYEGDT